MELAAESDSTSSRAASLPKSRGAAADRAASPEFCRALLARAFFSNSIYRRWRMDYHARVEALARLVHHFFHRFADGKSAPERTLRSQRVQTIHRRKNPRADGNLLAFQALRISRSIPLLMVRLHDGSHSRGEIHARQHFRAGHGMGFHFFPFLLRESSGLQQNMVGNSQLADVIDQASRREDPQAPLASFPAPFLRLWRRTARGGDADGRRDPWH